MSGERKPVSISTRNPISYFFHAWPWRLVWRGLWGTGLENEDIGDLPRKSKSSVRSDDLANLMTRNERKFKAKMDRSLSLNSDKIERLEVKLQSSSLSHRMKLEKQLEKLHKEREVLQERQKHVPYVSVGTWVARHRLQIGIMILRFMEVVMSLF